MDSTCARSRVRATTSSRCGAKSEKSACSLASSQRDLGAGGRLGEARDQRQRGRDRVVALAAHLAQVGELPVLELAIRRPANARSVAETLRRSQERVALGVERGAAARRARPRCRAASSRPRPSAACSPRRGRHEAGGIPARVADTATAPCSGTTSPGRKRHRSPRAQPEPASFLRATILPSPRHRPARVRAPPDYIKVLFINNLLNTATREAQPPGSPGSVRGRPGSRGELARSRSSSCPIASGDRVLRATSVYTAGTTPSVRNTEDHTP